LNTTWETAPTQTITAGGVEYAYEDFVKRALAFL